MFQDELRQLIEKYFKEIDKMESSRKDEVFLETHKSLCLILERDFEISEPIIGIRALNFRPNRNVNINADAPKQTNP